MGTFHEEIPPAIYKWILLQRVFWIASAPLSSDGHINISPKGGCYFGLLSPTKFWYIDLTGSGVETLSHLQEPQNGRITVLFNAFEGAPRIVRLWGKGSVLEYGSREFEDFVRVNGVREMCIDGTRAIVVVDIHQVGSSCGFSVPYYEFVGFRSTLNDFFVKRVKSEREGDRKNGIERYWAWKNAYSMDGLPGLRRGLETGKKEGVEPIKKMVGAYALEARGKNLQVGQDRLTSLAFLFLVAIMGFLGGVGMMIMLDKLGLKREWVARLGLA